MLEIGRRLPPHGETHSIEEFDATSVPGNTDVAVIGAGVIGLSIAWQLAGAGLSVIVFESAGVGAGASFAATGMLAAAAEHEAGGDDLLALALESQALWPQFVARLEQESEIDIDYRRQGTVLAALGRDEVDRLRFRFDLQRRSDLPSQWLNGEEVRRMEPALRPSVAAGIFCPGDHQVDPRRLLPALQRAIVSRGGRVIENCAVDALDYSAGAVSGVRTGRGVCRAKHVVVATGASPTPADLMPAGVALPVRPLKGQSLALKAVEGIAPLSHIVWTEQIHLAPKAQGRLIVGATVEEAGFDASVRAGGIYALLEAARRALPCIEEMEVEAIWSGFRPTSDDDAPIIGMARAAGPIVATGHHRNGILLAPVTAKAVADLITFGSIGGAARRFGLARFAPHSRTADKSLETQK